jgi:hypothetical protein
MAIQFRCAHCQATFPLTSQLEVAPQRCPICKHSSLAATYVAADPSAAPAPSAKTRRWSRGRAVLAGASAAAFLLGGAAILAVTQRTSEPVTAPASYLATVPEPTRAEEPASSASTVSEPATLRLHIPRPDPVVLATPPESGPAEPAVQPPTPDSTAPRKDPAPKAPVAKKRRAYSSAELRDQLLQAREINLTDIFASQRPDFLGLPFRMDSDSILDKEEVADLQLVGRKLRTALVLSKSSSDIDAATDALVLRALLLGENAEGLSPAQKLRIEAAKHAAAAMEGTSCQIPRQQELISGLMQIMAAEEPPARQLVVDLLQSIPGARAARALVACALYDLSAEVRASATAALRDRPRKESRELLLQGLRYPWAPVADHAAETLVALGDTAVVPSLVEFLKLPNPTVVEDRPGKKMTRELVRINHVSNCLMCHPISIVKSDPLRDEVPVLWRSQAIPVVMDRIYLSVQKSWAGARLTAQRKRSGTVVKYEDTQLFIRGDYTYLHQDFAAKQPVKVSGPWPKLQRYDYVVRLRPATPADLKLAETKNEQREAVLFALRELTGTDHGASADQWQKWFEENKRQYIAQRP